MPTTPRTWLRVAFAYDHNQRAVLCWRGGTTPPDPPAGAWPGGTTPPDPPVWADGHGDDHPYDPRWGHRLRRGRPPRRAPGYRHAQRRAGGERDDRGGAHHHRRG